MSLNTPLPNWRLVRWLQNLVTPRAQDPTRALKEQAVYALTLPLLALGVVFGLVDALAFQDASWLALLLDLGFMGALVFVYVLARRGHVRWSIWALLGITLAVATIYTLQEGYLSINSMFVMLIIAATGLTLGARFGFAVAALFSLWYGALIWAQVNGWFTPQTDIVAGEMALYFTILCFVLAGLTAVFGSWAYRTQRQQTLLLTEQMQAIQAAEREKNELLQALQERVQEQEKLFKQLELGDATQARLIRELRQTSSPVIPVLEQVIAMPIVGTLDVERGRLLMSDLLAGVERHHAQLVLLDITGASNVDEQVADILMQTVDAVHLLGAECILVGIRPDLAHALINLGIDLEGIVTRRDMQSGIEYALEHLKRAVVQ